ncbi:NnrS family protein [Alysiella crassa]|uniref:NnrS protein n=1 Tax=Alysiella crassa TaxID=153491 RepID=A0A376BK07_9NEIS|nr:NnrS family protein [Alysiella crassa]UOP07787.1 NnrS family protein [Alysiella crassa]SSY69968.1 NnrS protein [Alysiella crassa]
MLQKIMNHPIWAMAFRPFYLLAAAYGVISILLWGFGYTGTSALPAQYWHAHEMIWGYSGAVVVAFLLTAVATWTGQPPVRGKFLMVLVGLWLLARLTIFFGTAINVSYIAGTLFYWLAAVGMGISVVKSQNSRNYIAVFALFIFGLTHAVFHAYLEPFHPIELHNGLLAGLVMVSGFIGLIGNRIIPFFTARRLNVEQVATPMWAMLAALVLPMMMATLLMFQAALWLAGVLGLVGGVLGLVQSVRWFHKGVLPESMLWILHAGYAAASLGLLVLGVAQFSGGYNQLASLGVHLIAVGGIGLLTIGMMTRTALGHTARPLYPAPKGLTLAFWLMVAATVLRSVSALLMTVNATAYVHSYRTAAVLFAASLLIFFWRYAPWLTQPRLDGKQG